MLFLKRIKKELQPFQDPNTNKCFCWKNKVYFLLVRFTSAQFRIVSSEGAVYSDKANAE